MPTSTPIGAWHAATRGDWAGAEADYTAAIARGRDDADVYSNRGLARGYQRDWAGAEADYTAAIARGRDDADVYLRRGLARGQRDDWTGAEADFTAAIERGRDVADVYYLRGLARGYQRDWASGGGLHRGHRTRPGRRRRLPPRGQARGQRDDWASAEADFTAAIARGQDDATSTIGGARHAPTRRNTKRLSPTTTRLSASIRKTPRRTAAAPGFGPRVPKRSIVMGRGRSNRRHAPAS